LVNIRSCRDGIAYAMVRSHGVRGGEMLEALIALATLAGNTVIAAATTDRWEVARHKFARLLGRGDPQKEQLAEERLEETRKQLAGVSGQDLEKVQADLGHLWQLWLAGLLEEDPGAEAELRALVEEIRAQLPVASVAAVDHAVAAGRDVNISASQGGVAAGVIHGNVAPPCPADPSSAVGEAVEAEGQGTYYDDGWGGRTKEQAERLAEAEAERQAAEQLAKARAERALARANREAEERAKAEERHGAVAVHPSAPSQLAVYDDLVRSAFADLVKPGRLLFNPPDRMQLNQTERIEVRLTRTLELDTELLQHLRGPGEPQIEEIPTAPLIAVTLKGEAFRITAYSDEEQSVTQDEITTWEFDVRALKRGSQRLVMCVSLRIPVLGQSLEHKSIPIREAIIDVQVGAPALVAHFVSDNWQWFIGTAIAIAAVLVAMLFH
jgi:hypothetical protein